jgi:hypothetical protein
MGVTPRGATENGVNDMRHTPMRHAAGVTPATATLVIHGQRDVDGLVFSGDPRGEISFGRPDGTSDVYRPSDESERHPESAQELVVFRYAEFRRPSWSHAVS